MYGMSFVLLLAFFIYGVFTKIAPFLDYMKGVN